jgi:hypothetical protein
MPEIKNNFLKGRMNQDFDSRILPDGEYREAINLLISRSEGDTVGEFENVLGNTGYTLPGTNCHVIGHFVDETNNIAYLFSTNYDGNTRATSSNTCNILQVNLSTYSITTLVNGYWLNFSTQYPIYGVNLIDNLLFWTDNFNQPRRINVITAQQPNAYTTEAQISVAQYYPYDPIIPLERTTAIVKAGTTSTQIVLTTSCPNIKVGDIVTVNNKTQSPGTLEINNQTPPVKVTEIVSTVAPFDTFKVSPATTTGTPAQAAVIPTGTIIDFSRTTMQNTSEQYLSNFSIQTVDAVGQQGTDIEITDPTFGGLPRVGDIVKLQSTGSGTTLPYYDLRVATIALSNTSFNRWRITFDKSMTGPVSVGGANATGFQATDVITIGSNPDYNPNFKGDSKFLEDRFIRFSYRFRYENNEYSLMAPFTQIMFVPKQFGQFSLGQLTPDTGEDVNYYQDEVDAYTSTILQWFENDIDSIKLKIPVPTNLTELNTVYKVKEIDVLYRESDALAVKVLDTIEVSALSSTTSINYDDDITGFVTKNYIDYDYKSNKPYKTLPEGQTTRVYDKVPVKALGQELIANRIVYGNYTERMTPPATIDYRTSFSPRDARYSDYATEYPYSTVKQNRTYQIGFVLADYYGRQSDVILSSYDNLNSNEGSSIYVPYRNSSDATDVPVLDWIGQNLTVTIDNVFGNGTDPGQPGIYQEEGCIISSTLTDGDDGFEVDKTYNLAGTGGGQIRVTGISGGGTTGPITSYAVVNKGKGYSTGTIDIVGGDGSGEINITAVGSANPLGWYSYKVVVKQQEQEYYNVYLPGFVNGLPIQNRVWDGIPYSTLGSQVYPSTQPIETERNKIFFSTVLSDNINKIPRNLEAVGPTDEEYNSDELLYIRINNPNAKQNTVTGVRNTQYYPSQLVQNVLNLSTVKETELAAVPFVGFQMPANPSVNGALIESVGNERVYGILGPAGFQGEYGATVQVVQQPLVDGSGNYYGAVKNMPTGSIPWGDVADKASFYAADQNPFIMKVGQVSNYNNPVGAIVCGPFLLGTPPAAGNDVQHDTNYNDGIRTMQPILSVAETKPVFSLLDIFWETTLCGKLEQLNSMIETNYNGIVAITDNVGTFSETIGVNGQVGDAFYFVNGTGAQINSYTGLTPTISKVVRQSNTSQALTPISDYFDIAQTGTAGQYKIRAKKKFWYGDTSTSTDVYIISLDTTWDPGGGTTYTDSLNNAITLSLTNAAPSIYSDSARSATNFTVAMDSTDGPNVIQLFGLNGSADTTVVDGTQNRYKQLTWEIGNIAASPAANSTFSIDPTTGQITASGLVDETTYIFTATLRDANNGTGTLSATQNITVNVGTPFAPKAIASGRQTNAKLVGAGNAGEWIWGDVLNSYIATSNVLSSSPSLIYNAQKEYQATGGGNTCKAWLFQGTIEIEITMTSTPNSNPGDANSSFIIQHRTFTPPNINNYNSRSSWNQIASIVESNFNNQTATSNPQAIAVVVNNNTNTVTYRYKFDQLGEYRLITSPLSGDRAANAEIQVQFKDGMCRNSGGAYCSNNGPCTP